MTVERLQEQFADFIDELRASEATVVHLRVDYEREPPRLDFDLVDPYDEELVVELAREQGLDASPLTGPWVQVRPRGYPDDWPEE